MVLPDFSIKFVLLAKSRSLIFIFARIACKTYAKIRALNKKKWLAIANRVDKIKQTIWPVLFFTKFSDT